MTKGKKTPPFSKRTGARDFEVGYGKPRKDHQFKPGKSGNPSGRPKGAKNKTQGVGDERLNAIILKEAYRPVQIKEKGKPVTTTMATVIVRKMAVKAAKGQSRSIKYFTDLVAMAEADKRRRREETLPEALEYKAFWEPELRRREALGINGPAPVLHPDDVVIDFKTGEVTIIGPMTAEEKRRFDKGLEWLRAYEQEVEDLELMIADEKCAHIRPTLVAELESCTKVRDKLREAFGEPDVPDKRRQKLTSG